jgi:hypothetical protein
VVGSNCFAICAAGHQEFDDLTGISHTGLQPGDAATFKIITNRFIGNDILDAS